MGKVISIPQGSGLIPMSEWRSLKRRRKNLDDLQANLAELESEYEADLRTLYARLKRGAIVEDGTEE